MLAIEINADENEMRQITDAIADDESGDVDAHAHAAHWDYRTHNGCVTVQNPATGQHRTFKISTQAADAKFAPGERLLSLLVGPDNCHSYLTLGFVKADGVVLFRKHRGTQYEKLAAVVTNRSHYEAKGCIYHVEGRCRKCNRKLTTPESVASGIGPVCAGRD